MLTLFEYEYYFVLDCLRRSDIDSILKMNPKKVCSPPTLIAEAIIANNKQVTQHFLPYVTRFMYSIPYNECTEMLLQHLAKTQNVFGIINEFSLEDMKKVAPRYKTNNPTEYEYLVRTLCGEDFIEKNNPLLLLRSRIHTALTIDAVMKNIKLDDVGYIRNTDLLAEAYKKFRFELSDDMIKMLGGKLFSLPNVDFGRACVIKNAIAHFSRDDFEKLSIPDDFESGIYTNDELRFLYGASNISIDWKQKNLKNLSFDNFYYSILFGTSQEKSKFRASVFVELNKTFPADIIDMIFRRHF